MKRDYTSNFATCYGGGYEGYKKWVTEKFGIQFTEQEAEIAREYWEKFQKAYPDLVKKNGNN